MNTTIVSNQSTKDENKTLDELLADITLKKPITAYNYFILPHYIKEKENNPAIRLTDITKKFSKEWKKLPEEEKKEYIDKNEKDKEKYKQHYALVQKYLIEDYIKEGLSPFRCFSDKCIRDAIEKGEDETKAIYQAQSIWNLMTEEEKKEWSISSNKGNQWWEDAQELTEITPYSLFLHKKMAQAKDKISNMLSFKEINALWSQASVEEKKRYAKLTYQISLEKKRNLEIYEIVNRKKPSWPCTAIMFFCIDLKKEGIQPKANLSMKNLKILFDKLSDVEKGKYLNLAHREKLKYKYKLSEYKQNKGEKEREQKRETEKENETEKEKKRKKEKEKGYSNCISHFISEQMDKEVPQGVSFMDNCMKKWKKLSEVKKEKYKVLVDLNKKPIKQLKVYDYPVKPKSDYQLYVDDHLKTLDPNLSGCKKMEKCGNYWKEVSESEKSEYKKKAEKENIKYKNSLKEYKEKGFYKIKEDAELNTNNKKKRSRTLAQSQYNDQNIEKDNSVKEII